MAASSSRIQHYRFRPADSRADRGELVMETDLIPKALEQARRVNPKGIVRALWEGQVYEDIAADMPSDWHKFLRRLISTMTP